MRKFLHIILLAAAVSACGPRVIPRDKMADIYYDMFMTDQLLREDLDLRRQADTMLVYEAVFNRYGYDTDDYLHSLRHYLRDPERFAQVLQQVSDRLQKDAESLVPVIEHLEWVSRFNDMEGDFPLDSILNCFRTDTTDGRTYFVMDPLWLGPRFRMVSVPADTAGKAGADSLAAPADSLPSPADSLVGKDSVVVQERLEPLPLPHPLRPRSEVADEVAEVEEVEEQS